MSCGKKMQSRKWCIFVAIPSQMVVGGSVLRDTFPKKIIYFQNNFNIPFRMQSKAKKQKKIDCQYCNFKALFLCSFRPEDKDYLRTGPRVSDNRTSFCLRSDSSIISDDNGDTRTFDRIAAVLLHYLKKWRAQAFKRHLLISSTRDLDNDFKICDFL